MMIHCVLRLTAATATPVESSGRNPGSVRDNKTRTRDETRTARPAATAGRRRSRAHLGEQRISQQRHNNINTHGKQRDSNLGRRQTRAEVICQVQSPVLDVNLGAWTLAGEGILHNVPAHPLWSGEWTISLYTPRMWFGTWDTRKHAGCSGCIELQDCADGNRQIFLTSFQDGVVGCTIPLSALTFPPGKGGDLFESSRTRLCFHTPFFRKGHNNSS